jgi:hypothetical protein
MAGQGINGPFTFTTREYYDNNGNTNAAKGSTLSFEELDETLLALSASAASSTSVLEQDVTPTETVGGYNPLTTLDEGMTFTEFVVGLLTPYQAPTINNLVLKDGGTTVGGTREVGNDFDITNVTFTSTVDSNNDYPHSASIAWTGNINGSSGDDSFLITNSVLASSNNLSLPGNPYTFNRHTNGSINFTVTSKYPNNITSITTSTTSTYYIKSILAGTSTKLDNNYPASQSFYNAIVADSNNTTTLRSNSTWAPGGNTNTNPPSNWSYYIYDASYTDPTLFSSALPNQPITSGWVKLNDITVDNQYGVSVTLTVWRSLQPGAYANGSTLSFS